LLRWTQQVQEMQRGGVELIFRVHARGRGLERSSAVPNHAHDFARAPLAHQRSHLRFQYPSIYS